MKTLNLLILSCFFAFNSYAKRDTITINDFSYSPSSLSITLGDTVVFKWVGGTHPTASDDGSWTTFTLDATTNIMVLLIGSEGTFNYHCTAHGGVGTGMSGEIVVAGVTGIDGISSKNNQISIFPNPTSDMININFNVDAPKNVKISLNDILGKEVALLHNGEMNTGQHSLSYVIDNRLPGGIYFVNLNIGKFNSSRKLIVQ
ncbi:MAG: hypothetical protein COC01_07320 [Bacteroidetes bacterium]|nr:MAG: hypothetical protein COC01_07320 [Bacteroidota bacterium]